LASGILSSARQIGGFIGVALLGALQGEPTSVHGARTAALAAATAPWPAPAESPSASRGIIAHP